MLLLYSILVYNVLLVSVFFSVDPSIVSTCLSLGLIVLIIASITSPLVCPVNFADSSCRVKLKNKICLFDSQVLLYLQFLVLYDKI